MADYKLDIFKLLGRIDKKSSDDIYSTLSDDEKSGFFPLIIQRWMSGTQDERQIVLLNSFANPYIFSLSNHPQLLMKLFQICSSKIPKRYSWLAVKSKKKNGGILKIISEYYEMSLFEVKKLTVLPSNKEILQMAEELGYDKDEIKKLNKELGEL